MPGAYNVFIGWSGNYSKTAAKALKRWLRLTVQAARPWMSEDDIQAGARWLEEEDNALALKFGILCLEPHNLKSAWLHYEAGALSKALHAEKARVCPYLLGGLRPESVELPLSRFQMKLSDEDGTFDLVQSINANLSEPMPQDELRTLFDERYPKLEAELNAIPVPVGEAPRPSDKDLLAQILESVRGLDAAISRSTEQNTALLRSAVSQLVTESEARAAFGRIGSYTITPNVASGLVTGGTYVAPAQIMDGVFVKSLAEEVDAKEREKAKAISEARAMLRPRDADATTKGAKDEKKGKFKI